MWITAKQVRIFSSIVARNVGKAHEHIWDKLGRLLVTNKRWDRYSEDVVTLKIVRRNEHVAVLPTQIKKSVRMRRHSTIM